MADGTRGARAHAVTKGRFNWLDGLVDVERGLVSREIFVSDEIYQRELERVFARAWLFLGHVSQIPAPGEYFVSSRVLRLVDGGGVGDPLPRPRRARARVPELVPAPRRARSSTHERTCHRVRKPLLDVL